MKNLKSIFTVLVVFATTCASLHLYAQASVRKLSSTINHPSINVFDPYLSADANAIVFISDNAEDNVLTPFYTSRDNSDWEEPQMLPRSIYTRLNFLRGFALNADGKKIYFTTMKTPGVGGYDIWMSIRKGSTWGAPANLGLPINTKGNEAAPSLSADGKTIYFMRCDNMDQDKASNCKIFSADKKQNGQWNEPVELPASINTGNSQTPRIMADNETLIFSSDKMPGNKGGMDLYSTKHIDGNWTTPVPWDFINTKKDDQYVSVSALGRYIVKDAMGARRNELLEYLIPDELRPGGMMKIDGQVSGVSGNTIPSYISIVDLTKNKRVFSGRPYADGSFIVYVREGSKYELAIDPEQDNISYYSKQFDLTSDKIPQIEKVHAILKPLAAGDEIALDGIQFKPHSAEIDVAVSASDLKRLTRLVKGNPDLKFEIQVMLTGYLEDSIQFDPDLTEVIYDSIRTTYDDIDTLGQLYQRDTVMVRTTYHNDRTWQQADAIVQYLISEGAGESSFGTFGNAIPAMLPEDRKLIVRAAVRQK